MKFEIVLKVLVLLFSIVSVGMMVSYFVGILQTLSYMKCANTRIKEPSKKVSMLILIPALREQTIICETIQYFADLNCNNIDIHLCIAGSKREYINLERYGKSCGTKEIVYTFCKDKSWRQGFTVDYYEADDIENGDRATQLNHAAERYLHDGGNIDIVGVYDADSRPSTDTLMEVACSYLENPKCSYQQPAFFINAICEMTKRKENPILIANALYQNMWSIISEIPMWIKYSTRKGINKSNFYLIGHGEFFDLNTYKKFKFPEYEVTDGIQVGYRLGISSQNVKLLKNYCNDDVPHEVMSLIKQHRRWFGGCMRLIQAYKWCKDNDLKTSFMVVISGLWSQFRWAFTANLYIINLILSFGIYCVYGEVEYLICLLGLGILYCYTLPILSALLTPYKGKKQISFIAFMLLPIAIYIKGIGPNIYICNRLFGRKNEYGKVER